MNQTSLKQVIPEGYKQTEVGVIPDDWSASALEDFVHSLEAGISVNSVDKINAFTHGKHILKTSCVSKGYFYSKKAKSIIPSDINRAKTIPKDGAIIVSRMNTPDLVGELGFVDGYYSDLFLPDRLWQMRFKTNVKCNTRWLAYILSFPSIAKKIKESATGTSNSMKNISKGSLLSITFPSPHFKEQTAIANALSDVDLLLSELEKLIAKKQAIKTATMQQLLTGKTRLPQFAYVNSDESTEGELKNKATHQTSSQTTDTTTCQGKKKGTKPSELGEIPEDWEVSNASDLINFIGGYGFSSRLATDNGIKWLKIANVGLNKIKWDADSYLPKSLADNFKDYLLNVNDVVMALTRPLLNDKLKVARLKDNDLPALLNQRVAKLVPKGKNSLDYIYYVVQRAEFIAEMNLAMAGTDPPNVGTTALGNINILIPSSPVEQTAVANILTDMDEEIQALTKRLTKTRQIKQGMMQELLTGKTRLPFNINTTFKASI